MQENYLHNFLKLPQVVVTDVEVIIEPYALDSAFWAFGYIVI